MDKITIWEEEFGLSYKWFIPNYNGKTMKFASLAAAIDFCITCDVDYTVEYLIK